MGRFLEVLGRLREPYGRLLGPKWFLRGRQVPPRSPKKQPIGIKRCAQRSQGDPQIGAEVAKKKQKGANDENLKNDDLLTENIDLGGPKGQKLKEKLWKIRFTTVESSSAEDI